MNNLKTYCLRPSNDQKRSNVLWNMIGSVLFALSSVVLFAIAQRLTDAATAGVFSIAFTTGQLLATLGYYEVRSFQVTDTKHEFAFSHYFLARLVTCAVGLVFGAAYALISGSVLRGTLIALMSLYKMTDAFADVYEGEFHRNGRLDLLGKSLAFRTVLSCSGFVIALALTRNIVTASVVAVLLSLFAVCVFDVGLIGAFAKLKLRGAAKGAKKILMECAALCTGGFLSLYICNAAKYAIDGLMEPAAVSIFTALYLPTSAINLLSGFIFRPHLTDMGKMSNEGRFRELRMLMLKLLSAAELLTIICLIGAYLLGIPVLQAIFAIDLTGCRSALLLLILGGGFNAMSVLLFYALTALRAQRFLLLGYAITAAAALLTAGPFVRANGLFGGALCFMLLLLLQTILFIVFLFLVIRGKEKALLKK